MGLGIPIPDGDGTINSNPSSIGYRYEDMLRSRGKGLGRQYPTRPIAMSISHDILKVKICSKLYKK